MHVDIVAVAAGHGRLTSRGGCAVNRIVTVATEDGIFTAAASKHRVIARAARKRIVAAAAGHGIVASVANQEVFTGSNADVVIARAAVQRIAVVAFSRAANQRIIARAALERVLAYAANDVIGLRIADDVNVFNVAANVDIRDARRICARRNRAAVRRIDRDNFGVSGSIRIQLRAGRIVAVVAGNAVNRLVAAVGDLEFFNVVAVFAETVKHDIVVIVEVNDEVSAVLVSGRYRSAGTVSITVR